MMKTSVSLSVTTKISSQESRDVRDTQHQLLLTFFTSKKTENLNLKMTKSKSKKETFVLKVSNIT
jgi:hypothetical protein